MAYSSLVMSLQESHSKGELILMDGGICVWHLRRDKQITIRTLLSIKKGVGTKMLDILKSQDGAESLFAKCQTASPANEWYPKKGFHKVGANETGNGIHLTHWRLNL